MSDSYNPLQARRRSPVLGSRHGPMRGRAWKPVFRGVRVEAAVPLTLDVRSRAALLLHAVEDAHLSHMTAAEMRGVPLDPDDEVHVMVHDRRDRRYREGVRPHYRAAPSDCVELDGLPVSSPLQMFVELAGSRSLVETVIAGDYLVRKGFFTLQQLIDHCARIRGKHVRKARRAAALVRAGVDSAMETRLRLLLVFAGLPEPTINYRVYDQGGVLKRRFDLSYPEFRLIVEYDGRHHIERIEQWESDLERNEEIADNDWRVLVVLSRGIFNQPEQTISRVQRALLARGAKVRHLKDDWRAHFPTR